MSMYGGAMVDLIEMLFYGAEGPGFESSWANRPRENSLVTPAVNEYLFRIRHVELIRSSEKSKYLLDSQYTGNKRV